ncbi:hypothetical protein Hanom_Chr16g01501081 [Helianthus anomalus]
MAQDFIDFFLCKTLKNMYITCVIFFIKNCYIGVSGVFSLSLYIYRERGVCVCVCRGRIYRKPINTEKTSETLTSLFFGKKNTTCNIYVFKGFEQKKNQKSVDQFFFFFLKYKQVVYGSKQL